MKSKPYTFNYIFDKISCIPINFACNCGNGLLVEYTGPKPLILGFNLSNHIQQMYCKGKNDKVLVINYGKIGIDNIVLENVPGILWINK